MVKRLDMKIELASREIPTPKLPCGLSIVPFNSSMERELAQMIFKCYNGHGDLEFLQERATLDGCLALVKKEIAEGKLVAPIVVKCGEKFCGFAWTALHDGKYYVSEVGVVPEFQGKGIGRALVLSVLSNFKSAGIKEAYLGVSASNLPAAPLYKSIGFEIIREWDTKDLKKKK